MKKNNATVSVETISPTDAEKLLATQHEQQRVIRETWVNQLAQEIIMGNWKLSSDCLCIADGYLANGQHRLSAVIKANRACDFIVMRTDDKSIFGVIDCGIKRTTGDVLKEHGMSNTSDLSTISKIILDYKMKVMTRLGSNQSNRATRAQIVDFARNNSDKIMDVHGFVSPLYREARILTRTAAAAFLFLAEEKPENKAVARLFVKSLYNGDSSISAASMLHKRLLNAKLGTSLHGSYVFALLIKAYTSALNGTIPGVLRVADGEAFPQMP